MYHKIIIYLVIIVQCSIFIRESDKISFKWIDGNCDVIISMTLLLLKNYK